MEGMGDLEEQCEDAVFEVCDARERYPIQCATELGNCIELLNGKCIQEVNLKPTDPLIIPQLTEAQEAMLDKYKAEFINKKHALSEEKVASELQVMLNKIENMREVVQQLETDKLCEMNKLISK